MSGKKSILKKAEKYCEVNRHRFTAPRQLVLEILAKSKKPLGAYDILERLGQYINNPKPPTAYRAIDFWREQGFVHKIESLNAFVICCEEHTNTDTHFLVCDDCHAVEEIHTHKSVMDDLSTKFKPKHTFTETHGTCGECL